MPHFLGPNQKSRPLLVMEETLNQSKLKMLARMIVRSVKSEICPPVMKRIAVLIVLPTTRKDRRAYASSQIPEMPPEVLGDEEDEQLVTYEKGLVQGCYNRHPARRRDILITPY